jgi:hypothetical protein
MALVDKNIVITPNIGAAADPKIVFSGADATTSPQNVTMQVYPTSNGTLSIDGSVGQLFSVTSSMTGTIFSVNDISGIPSIEVLDTGLIKLAQYNGSVTIGGDATTGIRIGRGTGNIATNTAIGVTALNANTTGADNVAVGYDALRTNITGASNTAIGSNALRLNTNSFNTALGYLALTTNAGGSENTAVGQRALTANTGGTFNTAVGSNALRNNNNGGRNTAIGKEALDKNTTGNYSTAIGMGALNNNTTGENNVAIGFECFGNTTGSSNVAIGYGTARFQADGTTALTTASNSTYIGNQARGFSNSDNNSIVIGNQAIGIGANKTVIGNADTIATKLFGTLETTGDATINGVRVGKGANALTANTAIGDLALNNLANTGEGYNTAIGVSALKNNTSGAYNIAIGVLPLFLNTTGYNNTAIGVSSLQNSTTGSENTAIGSVALYSNTVGQFNTAIGKGALNSNTQGNGNVAIGKDSLLLNTLGSNNIGIGSQAGDLLTTGSNNTLIGVASNVLNNNNNNSIVIGYEAVGLGSNTTVIGNSSTISSTIYGTLKAADLTTTGNTILGNASTDTLNVGNGDLVKDASGNVGIGTSSPGVKLEVGGTSGTLVKIGTSTGNGSTNFWPLSVGDGNGAGGGTNQNFVRLGRFADGTAGIAAFQGGVGNSSLAFGTYETERMRIGPVGQIGLSGANYGTSGQVLTSNGSAAAPTWQPAAGGGSVTIGETAPASPTAGALWWDSASGALKIYYTDINSSQWVDAFVSAGGGATTTEIVYTVTGTTPAISPANGGIQTWTLTGNSTPTAGTWAQGQSLTLMVNDTASVYTVVWTSLGVVWVGGSAPTLLPGAGYTVIELWKVGSTIYGALVGQVA